MDIRRICLGLQGGGSHGAFTWGVLDTLLAAGNFEFAALSGSSAGAMNAVVLASGWVEGRAEGARRALKEFWDKIARSASGSESADLRALRGFLHLAHYFSPYELNPFDFNPLREIIAQSIDFEKLRAACPIDLFIGTTEVQSGRLRIFTTGEVTLDVLLASACLPTIHRSIEIDGEAYWDGGLTANPPIFPLLQTPGVEDLVLVLLQSHATVGVPTKAEEIAHRLTEISFGSSLWSELRALAWAQREGQRSFLGLGRLDRRLGHVRTHVIEAPEFLSQFDHLSKANTHPDFIASLFEAGVATAKQWLKIQGPSVGRRATFELAELL